MNSIFILDKALDKSGNTNEDTVSVFQESLDYAHHPSHITPLLKKEELNA
jgi:hypothetical protein